MPPGFKLDAPTAPQRPKVSGARPGALGVAPVDPRPIPLLPNLSATGDIVDGDTIRLGNGSNGRLYGFDAFEKGQPGYRADGSRSNLGDLSAGALAAYIRPSQSVITNGKQTYGRPVITLGDGADDPAINMLWQGAGYAAPEYLRDDPQRAASYTEAERLGRLNRQGGFSTGHIRPDAYRRPLTTRTAKLASDEYLAFDDQLPADAPKLKRLTPEQEKKIAAYVASQAGNKKFNIGQYRDWFRNELGVTDVEPVDNQKFIEDVRNGAGFSPSVDYSTLDAEAKRELEELIAFSGLRPEDAQGYRDLLKGADQSQVLEYARSKGMTLDPRDVSAYFAARTKGENAPIPLPIINPSDGRTGAAARGFGDPLGFLDEMGGVVDALGGTANRESIWNSDRSFSDIYDNNTRQNRAIIDYDETNHPGWRFGGQMVSGLALPGSIGVRGAAGYAKAGGAIGGIYGFGSADGTLGQRLANVPLNAAGGAILGGTLGPALDKSIEVLPGALRTAAERFGLTRAKATGFNDGGAGGLPMLPQPGHVANGIAPDGAPGSLAPSVRGASDELPEGFALDVPEASAPPMPRTVGDIAAVNMDADALPSLSSPRLRDVIDVGANRTTRLLDGPTEAMMRAATSRVQTGDVLPRPSNEVQSLDEFNRISDGLYPDAPDGAPHIDDVGQPATYDDILANTPPATAYDDWTNAVVSKVGNVRVDRLDSPQDIGQALKIADNVAGGFDNAKRGKISFAETQALAQDLGMTADDLLARRKGQAFSAEEAYAARAILAKSGNELVNIAKRIRSLDDDPGSEALATFRKALVRHAAIQEQVSGMTAEAGRALSAFRMVADSRDMPGRVLEGLATAGGGTGRLKDAADAILELERDPANLNRFVEKVSKPTFSDRAQEVWYNYLLSGPQTHMVNVLSNTMTALGQIPEHAVAAGIGATRRALSREASDRVLFSELGARSIGLLQGTKEGIREFARALRTGETSDFVTKMEQQTQKAVPGIKGAILRTPTRLLTAEDELFKAMARRMELSGLAVRQAAKEGRKGQEAKDRVAELIADPPDDMMHKVLDYGRYLTFQRPLGDGLAGGLSRITQNHPYLKAVLPFIRTPTNLIKFTAERSPLAPMVKEWRRDFAAGGARRDLAIAKVMVGSGVGAMIAELAEKGVITGSPPSDDNQRRLMMANGWQPSSIKIGDQYYSYRRLDPFAMTFGVAADLATMGEGMTDKQREKGAALWTASVVANLASRTWLSGVTDALEALQDPERYSGNFIKRLIGSATVPTGSAQIARTIDPTARETPDVGSYMSSRMPGQSDNLLPKRDVWGQPIVAEGGVGPDILSPIWTSTDRNDPITNEALRVGATISKPQKGDLTAEQYDRLQDVAGSVARKWIGQLMASPEYQAMDRESQADEIGEVMTRARKAAKASVLTGEPILDARPEKKRRGGSGAAALPDGFTLDPLPDGFVIDR